MRGMFYNLTRAKQAKALMLHFSDKGEEKALSISEYAVLRALAERMAQKTIKPKGRQTPTIANTCFPGLDSIARDAAMSEKTVRRAVEGLVEKGLIAKEVIHNWTWKGRKDHAPKHNGVRYRVTPIWDEVPVVEYGEDHDEADEQEETTAVSAETLAEVERVLAEDTKLPVGTKASASVTVTKEQADEVFDSIKYYFGTHPAIASKTHDDARGWMNNACVELAQRALKLDEINYAYYADRFLWWLIKRRNAECVRLRDKVDELGVSFGLPQSIAKLWGEFVPEKDFEIEGESHNDEPASDEPEHMEQDFAHDADDDYDEPVKATKAAKPIFDFDDDQEEVEPEPKANQFQGQRQVFVRALRKETDLLQRPSEGFTIELDSAQGVLIGLQARWLDSVPYGQQITQERVSPALLRLNIKWNVARYIVQHAEQFILDGYIDELYQPVVEEADREGHLVAA